MKQKFLKPAVAAAVLGAAMFAAGSAVAGIANTKHNLGAEGTGTNKTAATGEICVFCHTPHGADTGEGVAVPLWNKTLSDPLVYTTYDDLGTSTYDSAQAKVGSVTLACLTCHDGTQAIDNIINAPGSGMYDSTGGGTGGRTEGDGWTWAAGGSGAMTVDATGTLLSGVITNLGTDLTNDHPVSMQYGGGGISASNSAGPLRDSDFKMPLKVDNVNRWFVDNDFMEINGTGSSDGVLDVWDFKLYTRDTSGLTSENGVAFAGEDEPFVECGSCHDPHLQTTTFLRISTEAQGGGMSNAGSQICLACHTK